MLNFVSAPQRSAATECWI